MSQLNADQYLQLTKSQTYGQSDGLYWDKTNSQLVMVIADAIVARIDTTGITADLEFSGEARGDILRRGASAWEKYSAKTAGQILCGDGTDLIAAAMSGDATISAAGAVTLANPQRTIQSSTVTLTPDTIVGNSAGDIGHADGVELVAAVASKIILPVAVVINYTHGVAAYTDGGNITAGYKDGSSATGAIAALASFAAAASSVHCSVPTSGSALVNKALVLRSAAAFTNPGTATGTAAVKTYYRLIDA
jgi:hypothetical protein